MARFATLLAALALFVQPAAAVAQVLLSFHSFNGSVLVGRYPHTFVVFEGTLDSSGEPVNENYGYTAVSVTPAVLSGNVAGKVSSEKAKYLRTTNRHFTVPISDAQYHAIAAEIRRWRDEGGENYNLDRRNCVHFVARIAAMAGLRADVPANLVRRPKAWLNYVTRLNPHLGAREIK
jgi:hypothetical protein